MTATESICVSPEWAKKLKDAGWLQDTFFWVSNGRRGYSSEHKHPDIGEWFAAPTAEEILRRLPSTFNKSKGQNSYMYQMKIWRGTSWVIDYVPTLIANGMKKEKLLEKIQVVDSDSLANAAAAMFCYLKESNLLPPHYGNSKQ